MNKTDTLSGQDELRAAVRIIDNCTETFLDKFTAAELLALCRAHRASEWDFTPDTWTGRQVREALRGTPPQWDANEKPSYPSEQEDGAA